MIKYLGSKRRLVPLLADLAQAVAARSAIDLFTGTTRVAQAFRRLGCVVQAVDTARYAAALATTYVAWDPSPAEARSVAAAVARLDALPGRPGYVTDTFCRQARFFHPDNGARIDAVRAAIATDHAGTWLEPILLVSLLQAADRVDSTTGVQMAYLKAWAPRALRRLELRAPVPVDGPPGRALRADAAEVAGALDPADLAYLDPPYNQHRYYTNYHVWETLVAGDEPEHYGVACKRVDARDPSTRSAFDDRSALPGALARCVRDVDARVVVLSSSDDAWLGLDEVVSLAAELGPVRVLAVDAHRYVGARIGIHGPDGRKVGQVGRLRTTEYLVVAGRLRAGEAGAVAAAARAHGARCLGTRRAGATRRTATPTT